MKTTVSDLRNAIRKLGVTSVANSDDSHRWSPTDFATDLAELLMSPEEKLLALDVHGDGLLCCKRSISGRCHEHDRMLTILREAVAQAVSQVKGEPHVQN